MNIQMILALRYLNGRKLRTFLTTLAVIFGVVAIFGMNILIPTMLQAFQANMLAASNNVDLTVSHVTNEAFSPDVLDDVRGVSGVSVAQGMLSRPVNLPADYFDNDPAKADVISTVSLVGLDVESALQVRNYTVQDGRFLRTGDMAGCIIAQTLADNLGLKVGDSLPLPSTEGKVNLEIFGILPPRTLPGNEEVLVSLPEAQVLRDAGGKINIIEANFNTSDPAQRDTIQANIADRLGKDFQFNALSNGSDIFASIRLAQTMFNVFGVLALFMGGFIIFNTFRTLVAERRRDIGMLRAVGATRKTIIGMVLVEGLIQGGLGTALGILLGYLLGVVSLAAVGPMVSSFIHITLGKPVVTPTLLVGTLVLGVGITLLAGFMPAVSAGRITPLEALRPPVAGVTFRRTMSIGAIIGIILIALAAAALLSGDTALTTLGALTFMLGLVLLAPALVRPFTLMFGWIFQRITARGTGQLAEGNITRQPSRAAVTASTSMIALAILVVVGGLASTMKAGFSDVLKQTLGSDYLFFPPAIAVWGNNVGAGTDFANEIKAVDGVGPVSTFRFASAYADVKPAMPAKGQPADTADKGVAVSLLGLNPDTYPQVAMMDFQNGTADEAFPALKSGRTMIVNGVFASTAGLKVGDTVPLKTPTGRQDYRVIAIASDYLNVKVITGYVSQENLAEDFGKTEDVFIQLNLKPGVDRAVVEAQLVDIKQNYPQFALVSGEKYLTQTMELFNVAFSAMYVLFIFLAIPSLIATLNTLAIGVLERTREIGMVRAVGASQKQVRSMVLTEALLLAAVGIAFGLVSGVYLTYALISAFSSAGFPIDFLFPWNGLIYGAIIGLVFGALSAVIPARQAARLEIVQALRYE
jgi:putative ABC transport system permease protein